MKRLSLSLFGNHLLLSVLLLLLVVFPQASPFAPAVSVDCSRRKCQRQRGTSFVFPPGQYSLSNNVDEQFRQDVSQSRQHRKQQTKSTLGHAKLLVIFSAVCWLNFGVATPAFAAPPIAVIAEELGYFPVQSRDGTLTYIPKRVQRESTDQAVQLADYLHSKQVFLAGTYWCPHTSRQKELLGRQAFAMLDYVECAPKGYQATPKLCVDYKVEGYPTWIVPNDDGSTKQLAGERSLAEVAKFAGYGGSFSEDQEQVNPPPPIGGSACK